jgi:hypothetical protein
MAPFEKHPADPGAIEAEAGRLERLAARALDLEAVTSTAFRPAEANWDGMCAEELRSAPQPVRQAAQETSSALAWSATPLRYWAKEVTAFDTEVARIVADLAEQARDDYGVRGEDGKPPSSGAIARARAEAEAAARAQWWKAYETYVVSGSTTAAGMLRDGPTEANLKAARDVGALPSAPGAFTAFTALWHRGNMEAAAKRATELANKIKDGSYLPTDAELAELRDLLKQYASDEVFAHRFLTGLGPRGLLELTGTLATYQLDRPGKDEDDYLFDRGLAETVASLQTSLGVALATATRSRGTDTGPHGRGYVPGPNELSEQWLVDLMVAGRSTMGIGDPNSPARYLENVHGYQMLGVLLHNGDYDRRFLSLVGGDMVDFEHDSGKNSDLWVDDIRGDSIRFDWTHGHDDNKVPAGYDPIIGLMDALERNPEAAKDMFLGVTTYTSDGPDGGRLPRLDYLLTDRNWQPDVTGGPGWFGELMEHGKEYTNPALDKLGVVLEHATTDHPDPGARRLAEAIVYEVNVDEQAKGYDNGVDPHDGGRTREFKDNDLIHPELRDSMANIMSAYIFDVNRGIDDAHAGPPGLGAEFDQTQLTRFLADLGKDETAHATVSRAEAAYALGVYDEILSGRMDPHDDMDGHLRSMTNVSQRYGQVMGALDFGAASQEHATSAAADEAYNKGVEDRYKVAGFVVDQVMGKVVDKIPVPVAGDLAKEFVGDIMEQAEEAAKQDNTGRAVYNVGELIGAGRTSAATIGEMALYESGQLEGLPDRLTQDGHPKPVSEWDADDVVAWERYKAGHGQDTVGYAGDQSGTAYQNGYEWARDILNK